MIYQSSLTRDDRVISTDETVGAVIVTRNRPTLLRECIRAVMEQVPGPTLILVIDNASGPETGAVLAEFPDVLIVRMDSNAGGAGGFAAGIKAGLDLGMDWLWLMDDDGRPQRPDCLARLRETAECHGAQMVGPLVLDVSDPRRLAFPIRQRGRTEFFAEHIQAPVLGFAHLFNGALIGAGLFGRIGCPDARFFIRGDEVEFMLRAKRAGEGVLIDHRAPFLHPGSGPEIHPIFGGLFYAVMPVDPIKQFHQFRNRGYIFRHYGMWGWLAADFVRYAYLFLVSRHFDWHGWRNWVAATAEGVDGGFMAEPGPAGTLASPAGGRYARRPIAAWESWL